MTKRLALLLGGLLWASPAVADHPAECLVAAHQFEQVFPLPRVASAIAGKKLDVLVLGSGSSSLPGSNGAKSAYPASLQKALAEALRGVTVKVTANVKSRRTAADMAKALAPALASVKPSLVIWQTGTVDAMQAVDPDQFSATLDAGIREAQAAGADVVLINAQYSPRTESMIALSTYVEDMRWVALQHDVPLFNRFETMKVWADLGTFELASAANKLDTALRVHDCIGRLLADLVIEAAKLVGPQTEGGR
jgi:hypothetical protein